MQWWFDANGLARAQVILGAASLIVSLFLAVLGLWVAWRQMKIAEVQNEIMVATMARKPRLRLAVKPLQQQDQGLFCHLAIENNGSMPAPRSGFRIFLPHGHLTINMMMTADRNPSIGIAGSPDQFLGLSGVCESAVFVDSAVNLGDLTILKSFVDDVVIYWQLQSESEKFPPTGLSEIRISRTLESQIDWGGGERRLFIHQ